MQFVIQSLHCRETIDAWIRLQPPGEREKAALAAAALVQVDGSVDTVLHRVLPGHWRTLAEKGAQLDPQVWIEIACGRSLLDD